jgi:putative DNA methylase
LVRLLRPNEYKEGWNPVEDNQTPVWEALHQMIRELRGKGETAAGLLLAGMPQRSDPIRNLAYRLYTLCERKGWAEDARAYNELITSWAGIEIASHEKGHYGSQMSIEE